MSLSEQDRFNREWFGHPWAIDGLARQQGFTDEGERAAYWRLADDMRGRSILDIGVGPGRTVTLLRSLSDDYVGIDYLQEMVQAARERHPFADLRLGDARDLQDFPPGRFDLVVFSYSGIDLVSREDRARVLAEAWRVLEPGGTFWFSTLNLEGPAYRYRPWRPFAPRRPSRALGWLRYGVQRAQSFAPVPRRWRDYRRVVPLAQQGDGWALAPFFGGEWRVLTHYVTLPRQLADLDEAGFAPGPEVFEDARGRRVTSGEDLHQVLAFNILARKPG
ncbi:class I SAM-dependent methyltransferase [Ideonella sp. YS5]|uniref:class I SAM-dependent methyltransferase n=1 Tax=Ideonella sp. YS5 TaxID=3453714 RepID=UPI003EEDB963